MCDTIAGVAQRSELQFSKLVTRVRLPSPAHKKIGHTALFFYEEVARESICEALFCRQALSWYFLGEGLVGAWLMPAEHGEAGKPFSLALDCTK